MNLSRPQPQDDILGGGGDRTLSWAMTPFPLFYLTDRYLLICLINIVGFKGNARVIIPGLTACVECTLDLFPPQVRIL